MNTEQAAMYERLIQWSPDEAGASFPFSRRLARENGWTQDYTWRVMEEYKRFLFLAIYANHPVTPSEVIDQTWHLHLTYTQSYWEDVCGNILGKKLHHHPTKGGKQESRKHQTLFERTLQSYRQFFDENPPADIWMSGKKHASESYQWIPVNRYWLIRKPQFTSVGIAVSLVLSVAVAGCTYPGNELMQSVLVPAFITLLFIIGLVLFIFYLVGRSNRKGRYSDDSSSSTYTSSSSGGSDTGSSSDSGPSVSFAGFAGGEFGGGGAGGDFNSADSGSDGGSDGGSCSSGCSSSSD